MPYQNNRFLQLELEHKKLLRRQRNKDFSSDELVEKAQDFLTRVRESGRSIKDENQRIQLQSFARYWGLYFFKNTKQTPKEYPNTFLEDFQEDREKSVNEKYLHTLDALSNFDELKEDEKKFYGRKEELDCLEKWILEEQCRLAVILGPGGIGKTSLIANLSEKIKGKFVGLIWRSLRTAPYIDDILIDIITSISEQNDTKLSGNIENKVSYLIKLLNNYRYLIILDNFESIIQAGTSLSIAVSDNSQRYQEKYKGYEELIKNIATSEHQSCLLITSREKSEELSIIIKNNKYSAHTLSLEGLSIEEGIEMLEDLQNSSKEYSEESKLLMSKIVKRFNGNPLALQFAALRIKRDFAGDIGDFYKSQQSGLLGDIDDLIDEHFSRLSKHERSIMYWLAIAQDEISIDKLIENFREFEEQDKEKQINNLIKSLERRFIIGRKKNVLSLQGVVYEYVIREFIEQIRQEIVSVSDKSHKIDLISSHFLIEAQTADHIRESQIRSIVNPLLERLRNDLGSDIENKLNKLKKILQAPSYKKKDYAAGNIINLFCHLNVDFNNENFSDLTNLTIWQAYLKEQKLHNVDFSNCDLSKSVFAEMLGCIWSVSFDSNRNYLVTGDTEGRICLWQAETYSLLCSTPVNYERISSVSWSPTDNIIASSNDNNTIKLWKINRQNIDGQNKFEIKEFKKPLEGHEGWVWSIAFSRDGKLLASSSQDTKVKLWDIITGECLNTFGDSDGHKDQVWSVKFSPIKDNILASCSSDETFKLWDIETGECIKTFYDTSPVYSIVFSPTDEQSLASCNEEGDIKLWNINERKPKNILTEHTQRIWSLDFSPDGKLLASGSDDETVKVWEIATGKLIRDFKGSRAHTNWLRSVSFYPEDNRNLLASGGEDKSVKIWDVNTGECLKTLQGSANRVWAVAFSPQPNKEYSLIASGSDDQAVRLWKWDGKKGQCIRTLPGHKGQVQSVNFSPNGKILASGSEDRSIKLWNVKTGEHLKTFEGHKDRVRSVTFSPDGKVLASASDDRSIKLWDANTYECLKTLKGHTDRVRSVAFSPDGQILASAGEDKIVKLWDINTYECLKTLKGHDRWVWSVAFSPDGQLLASGSEDKTVKLWDLRTKECIKTLKEHTRRVWSVAFNPDGKMLASGSDDRTVKLWNISEKKCVSTFDGHTSDAHTSWIQSVSFSPDGQILASASEDQSIKLWDVKTGKCLETMTDRLYENMKIKGVKLSETTKETLKSLGAVE